MVVPFTQHRFEEMLDLNSIEMLETVVGKMTKVCFTAKLSQTTVVLNLLLSCIVPLFVN